MGLDGEDWVRLGELLYKSRHGGLAVSEQDELREVLARHSPRAHTMPFDELTHLGFFLIGLYALHEGIAA